MASDEGPNLLGELFKTFIVLGVVVALIYLTLNVGLRRLMGARAVGGTGAMVSLLQRIPLDNKRVLYVVRAGAEYLLLGAGEGAVSLLTKLDAQEIQRLQAERPAGPTLSPFLQRLLARRTGPPPPSA